jgi:hypothetical protein
MHHDLRLIDGAAEEFEPAFAAGVREGLGSSECAIGAPAASTPGGAYCIFPDSGPIFGTGTSREEEVIRCELRD